MNTSAPARQIRVLVRGVKGGGNLTDEFLSEKMRIRVFWEDWGRGMVVGFLAGLLAAWVLGALWV